MRVVGGSSADLIPFGYILPRKRRSMDPKQEGKVEISRTELREIIKMERLLMMGRLDMRVEKRF